MVHMWNDAVLHAQQDREALLKQRPAQLINLWASTLRDQQQDFSVLALQQDPCVIAGVEM